MSNPRPTNESVNKFLPHVEMYNGVVTVNNTVPYLAYHREWSGSVTPNYKEKAAHGDLPVNPFHMYTIDVSDSGLYNEVIGNPIIAADSSVSLSSVSGSSGTSFAGPGPGTALHDLSRRNQLISKLIAASESDINNIAQDFVQYDQTVRMIANTCNRLSAAIRAVRGRNIPQAISSLFGSSPPRFRPHGGPSVHRTTADNWLELQYGWKPLLQDVRGAMEALARYNYANRLVQTVTASTRKDHNQVIDLTLQPYPCNYACGKWISVSKTWIRMGFRYKVDNHLTALLSQTGFTNPINLMWEVLPYSFVVDWFLPIGPYLESFTAWKGLSFVDGFETHFTREKTFCDIHYNGLAWSPGAPFRNTVLVVGNLVAEAVRLDRTVLTTFPSMTFPSFKNPLSATHALNAMALMVNAFFK